MIAVRGMLGGVLVAAIVNVGACVHPAAGVRRGPWQLRGSVVALDNGVLRVRHKSGQIVEVVVDDETVIAGGTAPVTARSLSAGVRVIVDIEPIDGGRQRARRISVSGIPANPHAAGAGRSFASARTSI